VQTAPAIKVPFSVFLDMHSPLGWRFERLGSKYGAGPAAVS